ncbi:MAG: hypothetical protein ACI4V7_08355 [Succinivibrionaceae bacterium]
MGQIDILLKALLSISKRFANAINLGIDRGKKINHNSLEDFNTTFGIQFGIENQTKIDNEMLIT